MSDQHRSADDQRYIHFLTFSVYRRRRLFTLDTPNRIVLGSKSGRLIGNGVPPAGMKHGGRCSGSMGGC